MQQVRIFGEVITVDPNRCVRSLGQCITCYLEGKIPCQEGTIIQTIEVESEKEYRCKYCEVPEKPQRVGHYSKVKELKPIIVASVEKGLGIRQASREYGLAINTVRSMVRGDNNASQAQKERRAREKEHHWLRFALKGLAVHSEIYTTQEMIDRAIELLIKYMKGNPQRTICELIPEARQGASFRAEVLVEKTLEIMNEECLNYCSDIFEKVEDGVYKLKTAIK